MFKIALNLRKPYNYAFFCPDSKLHLTVSNPVGFVHEVTTAIFNGLKYDTLIDVDGAIDLSTGSTGKAKEAEQEKQIIPQNDSNNTSEQPKDNTGKKKRGRKPVQMSAEEAPNSPFDSIDQ